MASTSQWVWDNNYNLYYNPATRTWAAIKSDGTWSYSNQTSSTSAAQSSTASSAANTRQPTSYADIDEGAHASGLPVDQLWPQDDDDLPDTVTGTPPLLRLVVKSGSPVLSQGNIACFDPADVVTIGRDKSFDKRIRLKELPVSKDHATVCWIPDGEYWAVIDNGSTHGTFIKPRGGQEKRLSKPKTASSPAQLSHLDRLSIGNTMFVAHIHPSLACSDCSLAPDSSNVISLITDSNNSQLDKKVPAFVVKTKEEKEQDRRAAMQGLKQQYLKPKAKVKPARDLDASRVMVQSSAVGVPGFDSSDQPIKPMPTFDQPAKPTFIDRAAARRKRDIGAQEPMLPTSTSHSSLASPMGLPAMPSSAVVPSSPAPDPFSATSKGAILLQKMGAGGNLNQATLSSPPLLLNGESSQSSERSGSGGGAGLGSLIDPKTFCMASEARPGLGSRPLVSLMDLDAVNGGDKRSAAGDWREDVREKNRKRFREM